MRILAGDIGGTHTRLAFCRVDGISVARDVEATYDSRDHAGLGDIAREFIAHARAKLADGGEEPIAAACFGIPGPVQGRRARTTNLPWQIDADELERALGIGSVFLLNDLEASARGLPTLTSADFRTLRAGAPGAIGNAGLVAAGTGLGQAGLFWDGRRHRPFACEGGHTSFAPGNEREVELLRWLRPQFDEHVSWERVVSGPGVHNLYRFLRDVEGTSEAPAVAQEIAAGDPPAVITRHGVDGSDALCRAAIEWFMTLWGAEAGNVALKFFAVGGIVLGGGFSGRLADLLPTSGFVAAFDDKGRMRPLLERIGIRILVNDKVALQGAAYHAHRRARGDHD